MPRWPRNDCPLPFIRCLICSCCGRYTTGRQWHNRDTGYGLCPKCADFIATRETPEETVIRYGIRGTHYDIPEKPRHD